MGSGISCGAETPEVESPEAPEVESDDSDKVEIFAESPEEEAEIRARMEKYKIAMEKKRRMKEMSKMQKRQAAFDDKAIKMLRKQLSDIICMKQLTTKYQKGRFGVNDYCKNRMYLPNR